MMQLRNSKLTHKKGNQKRLVGILVLLVIMMNGLISTNRSLLSPKLDDYSNKLEENSNIFVDPKITDLNSQSDDQNQEISVIVVVKENMLSNFINIIESKNDIVIIRIFYDFNQLILELPFCLIQFLKIPEYIIGIYLNDPQNIELDINERLINPYSASENSFTNVSELISSDPNKIQQELNTDKPTNGSDVIIAVLDTGVDLLGQLGKGLDDFDDNESTLLDIKVYGSVSMIPYEPFYYYDFTGSGTYHAGVACGTGNPNSTFSGVAPGAYYLNVKVVDSFGFTMGSYVLSGLEWALSHDADVICLPWIMPGYYADPISIAIDSIAEKGVSVVVPAGDDGPAYTSIMTPGQSSRAISVGAYDHNIDSIAQFSSKGPSYDLRSGPDILAPGVDIIGPRATFDPDLALNNTMGSFPLPTNISLPSHNFSMPIYGEPVDGNYTSISSTTASCAIVAGACAILTSLFPLATPELIKIALMKTAASKTGDINSEGYGLINVTRAAKWIQENLDQDTTIGFRIPQTMLYPGFVTNADVRNLTSRLDPLPQNWSTYNIFMPMSTQAMTSALFVVNGTEIDESNIDLHLPLNQFALSFNSSHYLFSELQVYRELTNITSYLGIGDSNYCRWGGILGINEELFISVIINTWMYTYDGYEPPTYVRANYTERVTAFEFSFNFLNIGDKSYENLSIHSFFKSDLYLNEYNITDPYNYSEITNSSYDDIIYYRNDTQMIVSYDKFDIGPNATNEYTYIGFNSTSHVLKSWEINSSNNLFEKLYRGDLELSNDSISIEYEDEIDPAFIQSYEITELLTPGCVANFTGVLSIGKDYDNETAFYKMNHAIQTIMNNVSLPDIVDAAIIQADITRMHQVNERFSSRSYLINMGTTTISSTEYWFVANITNNKGKIEIYSEIDTLTDWKPMAIRIIDNGWIPDDIGSVILGWVLGSYTSLYSGMDDNPYNDYQVRTVFVYNYSLYYEKLSETTLLMPYQFPITPFLLKFPGDFAMVNISLITPIPIEEPTIEITGMAESIVTLKSSNEFTSDSLSSFRKFQLSIILPLFFKPDFYITIIKFSDSFGTLLKILPIQFQVENLGGRIMFDGIHNEIGISSLGSSTSMDDISSEFNITETGFSISGLLNERLDYLYGNYFQFWNQSTEILPKGIAMTQIIPGINFSSIAADFMTSNDTASTLMPTESDSLALDMLFQGDNFYNFEGNLTTDNYTYDLVKFFDALVISDPERPFNNNEIGNLSRYLNLGGMILIFTENESQSNLESINELAAIGNLTTGDQDFGLINQDIQLFDEEQCIQYTDPIVIKNSTEYTENIEFIGDYIGISKVGRGKLVLCGDTQIITELGIYNEENREFIQDFLDYIMDNSFNMSYKISDSDIETNQSTYIEFNLNNPLDNFIIEEDLLAISAFIDEAGNQLNVSLYGFQIPVMPLLQTNETALYSFFNSSWFNSEGIIYAIIYLDSPETLAETFTFEINITLGTPLDPIQEYQLPEPKYPPWYDFLFLIALLIQICVFWAYSSIRWSMKHKFIDLDSNKRNLLENTVSAFNAELNQIEQAMNSNQFEGLEKLRYILDHEKEINSRLDDIHHLADDWGEI
ncbi:MAG: S8 family serine peptidase [Candidatus Lokiarchaeota archaeon]|nr:S8 family serine peptidase [Candidatus Lokiarchaeota archaeon]